MSEDTGGKNWKHARWIMTIGVAILAMLASVEAGVRAGLAPDYFSGSRTMTMLIEVPRLPWFEPVLYFISGVAVALWAVQYSVKSIYSSKVPSSGTGPHRINKEAVRSMISIFLRFRLQPASEHGKILLDRLPAHVRNDTAAAELNAYAALLAIDFADLQKLIGAYRHRFGPIVEVIAPSSGFNQFEVLSATRKLAHEVLRLPRSAKAAEALAANGDFIALRSALQRLQRGIEVRLRILTATSEVNG